MREVARLKIPGFRRHEVCQIMCEMGFSTLVGPAGFLDAAPLRNVPGVVALAELEEQLGYLHAVHPGTRSIIALRIGNAAHFHAVMEHVQYAKVLEHVASVVRDLLDDPELVMAHAGRGELVALIPPPPQMLAVVLAQDIATHIAVEAKIYQRRFVPVPIVFVGDPVCIDGFVHHSAATLIEEARKAARAMPA